MNAKINRPAPSKNEQPVLVKTSTQPQIKDYFKKVIELKQSKEQFPIDLDDVYSLVYNKKGIAVKRLMFLYTEGIDYQSLHQNVKREIGGSVRTVYMLSIECFEHLICRKNRSVFEVYRQVFHKALEKHLSNDSLVSIPEYCEEFNKTIRSFYGLKAHYKKAFVFNGVADYMYNWFFNHLKERKKVDEERLQYNTRHQLQLQMANQLNLFS